MYLANDIYSKKKLLLKGSPVEILKKISQEPVIFSVKVNGEIYPVSGFDLTDTKPKK